MQTRRLIINADGYGLTAGANKGIEECIRFGTVKSVSINVNFPHAQEISRLVRDCPELSVGCHLNPVVGKPVMPEEKVPSLLNEDGEFWYRSFDWKLSLGHIRLEELRAELLAQIEQCRQLAGRNFSHIDCHMAKHRLPRFYPLFLDACRHSRIGRVRTHKYFFVDASRGFSGYCLRHPRRLGVQAWNLWLRRRARKAGLAMPDWNVAPSGPTISLSGWTKLLAHLPPGVSEFVVHPAYADDHLRRVSRYVDEREKEREILTSDAFREALDSSASLASYCDIPLVKQR